MIGKQINRFSLPHLTAAPPHGVLRTNLSASWQKAFYSQPGFFEDSDIN